MRRRKGNQGEGILSIWKLLLCRCWWQAGDRVPIIRQEGFQAVGLVCCHPPVSVGCLSGQLRYRIREQLGPEIRLVRFVFFRWVHIQKEDPVESQGEGLPWWLSGKESTYRCRSHGFDPWSGKIPHAVREVAQPMCHNCWRLCSTREVTTQWAACAPQLEKGCV